MSYSTNYAGLKADLIQDSDDFSSDYLANLDTIIADSETKVLRDLDLEIFQSEVSKDAIGNNLALSPNVRTFQRPTSLIQIKALWLVVSGSRKFIQKRAKGYCEMYGEDSTVSELPSYYAEHNESELYFVRTPDQSYPVIMHGITRPAGLSQSNPTTWLSVNAGDLLLMACKIRGEQYLTHPDKANLWKGEYTGDLLPKAKIELRGMTRASYEAAKMASTASQQI